MSEEKNLQAEAGALGKQDVIDQLLKPEVQESITALVDQLPKLTELMNLLTKSYDFAQSIATDEILKNDTVGAVKEVATPVVESVKNMAANVIEAKERAEQSHEAIGLFGLLRMIKDPQAQKLFRFLNAFLQVVNEKEKNHDKDGR
ncbi:MAG: DUF1641 domain-containing protein [Tuberibacillus sp.]